jgi:CRISPR-associated endonuclease/helicase Cas3
MESKTSLRERMFFAHSIDGQKPETWQTLAKHLQAVSLLTSMLAKKFGAEQLGAIVGLLHDLGKYSHQFQAYIAGRSVSPDHATAGAREIQRFTGAADPKDRVAALIGAYCIAGHHSGLPNWSGDRALSDRLKKQLPALDPIWQEELTPDLSSLFPENFKPTKTKTALPSSSQCSGGCCFPVSSMPTAAIRKVSMPR